MSRSADGRRTWISFRLIWNFFHPLWISFRVDLDFLPPDLEILPPRKDEARATVAP
jgi:hypothetical protein